MDRLIFERLYILEFADEICYFNVMKVVDSGVEPRNRRPLHERQRARQERNFCPIFCLLQKINLV